MPPYRDLFEITEEGMKINSTLANYIFIFLTLSPKIISQFFSLALVSTIICLIIGYPLLFMLQNPKRVQEIYC